MIGNEPRYDYASMGSSRSARRGWPVVILGVLGTFLMVVFWMAAIRDFGGPRPIAGTAYAVGEQSELSDADTPVDISKNSLLVPGREVAAAQCAMLPLGTTAAQLEAFYREGLVCLDRAWTPVLRAIGKPVVSPKLSIADVPKARCGVTPTEDEALAFYCNRDRTIYMPRERLMRSAGDSAPYHLAVLAHEYGHHVQALTGILSASALREDAAEESEALEISRRTELQANCLGGLFLDAAKRGGALSADFVDEAADSFGDTLSSETHGSRRNQLAWAKRGTGGGTTASCDTWSAQSVDVE
ncbi:hypothetical protein SAMN04487818_12047 [Actinokineospora terrae]|uniref:Neutral zinc metallopeptidase n=2 Tax=Actinokineospora terrae TaxID=155974 RepID=A0A1H9XSD3_9PSEU|nr:hypothetical protein SAMN04487818_12047 [Actinokineospora terrae]